MRTSVAMTVVDRAAWLAERRRGVGASDVAGILGRSPWASPWSVWVDKVGLAPLDDDDPAPPLLLGRDLEPIIARWFHRVTELHVHGEQTVIRHPDDERWFATVDGFVLEPGTDDVGQALGVFEAKYTADRRWEQVPEHYALQAQWALYCSGLDQVWLAAMHLPFGRPEFEVYEIARDERLIAEVALAVEHWWNTYVEGATPPPADGHRATTSALAAAWLDPVSVPAVDVAPLAHVVSELAELRSTKRQLEADIERDENIIKAALGSHTEGVIDGQVVVSWRQQSRTLVDQHAVRRDHGDAYDVHGTHRVLRLHRPPKPRRSA